MMDVDLEPFHAARIVVGIGTSQWIRLHEVRVIGNHPLIADRDRLPSVQGMLHSGRETVRATIGRVAILIHNRFFHVGTREIFGAGYSGAVIFHAASLLVAVAGSVDLELGDYAVQFKISRDFGGDDVVDLLGGVELAFAVQEEKDVGVGKAALLEFNRVDACYMPAEDVVPTELLQHLFEF